MSHHVLKVLASALIAASVGSAAEAAESVVCSTSKVTVSGKPYQQLFCAITEPDVTVPFKEYKQIAYHNGDQIQIFANGCVQRGGHGKTWYSYTWPTGDGSDLLYHGLIYLPGVWDWRGGAVTYPHTWSWDGNDVKRIGFTSGQSYTVGNGGKVPGNWLHLWLGYEDDGYKDNGYYAHDEGPNGQCSTQGAHGNQTGGPAWINVYILHPANAPADPADSSAPPPWAKWTFPPPPPPPNPLHASLSESYAGGAGRTIYYRGETGLVSQSCTSFGISSVTNTSPYTIYLAYGLTDQNPLDATALASNQKTGAFNGRDLNAGWQAWGPESGTLTNKHLSPSFDIAWVCLAKPGDQGSSSSGLTSTLILPPSSTVVLKTADGHYLTAVNGGGYGGPATGPQAVALHTDATAAGPSEHFKLEWRDAAHQQIALKTPNGHYLTATKGGGLGGPNDATSPVHTDAPWLGPDERLTLSYDAAAGTATLRTRTGRYLTAVNGGGVGGPDTAPVHTDASSAGPWETFGLVTVQTVGLKTVDGHFLTAANGGGIGGPNTGPQAVALHTDATSAGPWEHFRVEWLNAPLGQFALKTPNGGYVSAVNGGGIGGPSDSSSPVHTDAPALGPFETLTLIYDAATGLATLQAPDGRYLTAVDGGGVGGPANAPIVTNAVAIGPREAFTLVAKP